MKRKIIAIFVVLLLTTISLNVVQAGGITETNEENESVLVEYANVNEDGTFTTESILLTEAEVVDLENQISSLMEEIQSAEDWESVTDIVNNYLAQSTPIFSNIFKIFSKLTGLFTRAFVISSGFGYNFNPLRKSSFKIRRTFTIWHYSPEKFFKGRTIILKPLALKMKILSGIQVGFMTRFTGIYLFIDRGFPEKSYTFFMGMARHINGFQFLSNIK